MTHAQMAAIVRDYTAKAVTEALAPVLALNKALELRLLELETRPVVVPPGEQGEPGLPGVGVASLLLSADARLIAHLTDGRTLDAGPVPRGTPGDPGTPGDKGDPGEPGRPGTDADPALVLEVKRGLDGLQEELELRVKALERTDLDPADIATTFQGFLQKELGVLEPVRPRPTVKRIEKTPSGYLVTEV